uniref:FBA domain-containing protein n=1 Tax=Haplochromis burtoni TaxID=8153 RepID=A0A3Q2V9B0_HAPBU
MCVCTLCSMKTIFSPHRMCIKSQLIDLEKEGYSPSVMDHAQPDIKISDWILSRFDCGGSYDIRVELLDQKKQLIEIFSPETIYCGTGRVGYIRFTRRGRDLRWWKGHFGIHITGSSELFPTLDT